MAPKPPSETDPGVSFSWPGEKRPREPGVLDMRLKARAEREAASRGRRQGRGKQGRSKESEESEASEESKRPEQPQQSQGAQQSHRAQAQARLATKATPTVKAQPARRLTQSTRRAPSQSGAPPEAQGSGGASPRQPQPSQMQTRVTSPARRETTESRERWIVTELRRQAVTSEASLRDMSERMDQLARTLRQVVDYLPRLSARAPAGSTAALAADAAVSRRLDELEARFEARFDEVAGAITGRPIAPTGAATSGAAPPATVDTDAIRAHVREEMAAVTAELAEMGDRMRAELVTATGQAEARLNRDRDQLREILNQTMGKLNELMGGAVGRDDLRQFWVEMAAKLAKQNETVLAEREQLRADLAHRMDEIAAEREQLRVEVGERLARVAEAAAVRSRTAAEDSAPLAAASAAQKAAIDEVRRELNQLGAQLLAAINPKNRTQASAFDEQTVETIKHSMGQAAAALSSAASKNDIEGLRNQLGGAFTRLERSISARLEAEQRKWDEQLATALEAVKLTLEAAELNRQTLLAEVATAVRASMAGVAGMLPPARS